MFRSYFTVGSLSLISRFVGFVRDKLIAHHLGSGALADVWIAAFQLPNLFRRLFGEGAFNSAFVPMYGRRLEEQGEAVADDFAGRTLSTMGVILLACLVLCWVFMEPIVRFTNLGFAADERLEVAVRASRITVGYLVFICLVAALGGILNSRKVFAAPAFAYVALNLVFLAGLVWVIPRVTDPLLVLSWCVIVAGVVQLAIVLASCLRHGVDLRPRLPRWDGDMRRLAQLMGPGMVSTGVQQLNFLVGGAVASYELGGKIAMSLADRIHQLPLGLIGMAASVVLLPEITRHLRGGDEAEAQRSLSQGLELSLFLCLPATAAMLVLSREIMFAIFEGGKFAGEAAVQAGGILAALAIGTPAYVLAKVLQPAYYAQEDTQTPMRYTLATALANLILVYPLFLWLGVVGCALATSLAGWVNVTLLWCGLRRTGLLRLSRGFSSRFLRLLLSALIMAGIVGMLAHWGQGILMAEGHFTRRFGTMILLVGCGVAVYAAAVLGLRVYSQEELRRRFRKTPRLG